MSEFLSNPDVEREREEALESIITKYFPEYGEFLAGMDAEDLIGAVYGQLLEIGEDADEVLQKYGVTERENK